MGAHIIQHILTFNWHGHQWHRGGATADDEKKKVETFDRLQLDIEIE